MAPSRAARRVKILFLDADYAWRVFFATRSSAGNCDWPQSNAIKHGAVKDKLFPAFFSRRSAAWHSAARWGATRRSLQCSPCYDKQYSLYFFNVQRGAAFGGAVPSDEWDGREMTNQSLSTPVNQTCRYDNYLCQEYKYDLFVSLKNRVINFEPQIWCFF